MPGPTLYELLEILVKKGGSDLHISSGSPPRMRIDGELIPANDIILSPSDTKALLYSVLTDKQKNKFEETNELDLSFGVKGLCRFRANMFMQRGAMSAALRTIPYEIMPFEKLGLPPVVSEEFTTKPRGLILVTGPTGSGKSSTLAAIIDKINKEQSGHIITIEDPIEFLHNHQKCLVNQREVGSDTESFKNALRYILRQDPDVVLIGEMRDLETVEAAMTIAETGHLTFGTLHTNTSVQTITRILDIFPQGQQSQVRVQLSFVLEGIISQNLLARQGGGRCMAAEVFVPTPGIRNLIREGKIEQVYSMMQTGQSKYGMQTMNQSLLKLFREGSISRDQAVTTSPLPEELMNMIEGGPVGGKLKSNSYSR
ncbi:MAG: type IV pilus twitching motility protein PilT [Nitrospirae bacterium]|nr:type IV pilus twitching motility protein PilT [Nitrospirota bacterium]